MGDNVKPTDLAQFPFPDGIEARGYRVFPDKLETDPLVAFHGTAAENLHSIIHEGFAFKGDLRSFSFAKSSALALKYACDKRNDTSPDGCIIVARFRSLEGVVDEPSVIYVHNSERLPAIIGYCIVPAAYAHL